MEPGCSNCQKDDKIKELIESFPHEEGWVRSKYDLSNDMFFRNPIDRFLDVELENKNYS